MRRLVLLVVLLWTAAPVFGEMPPVFRLEGDESCATGFSGPGGIWTSAHFGRELCPQGRCKNVSITNRAGKELTCGDLSFVEHLPELDIGVLRCSGATEPLKFHDGDLPKEVSVVSFPKCGNLTVSTGKITDDSSLFVSTSATGRYGSSGAPLLTYDNKVIGVVTASSSLFWAALANVTGGSFPLRASKLSAKVREIPYLPGIPRGLSLPKEASDSFLAFYRDSVRTATGLNRFLRGDEFIEIGRGLRRRFKISPFNWTSTYLGETPEEVLRELGDAAPLYFALLMEERGPYHFMGKKMKIEDVSRVLSPLNLGDKAYSESEEVLTLAIASTYPGFQSSSIALSMAIGALGYVLAAISFISLIIIWRLRSRG